MRGHDESNNLGPWYYIAHARSAAPMSRVWRFPTSLERRVYRSIAQDIIEYPRHIVIEALAIESQDRFPWHVGRQHLVQRAYAIEPFKFRFFDRSARPVVQECA